jgi:hypothetical protein
MDIILVNTTGYPKKTKTIEKSIVRIWMRQHSAERKDA